MNKLITTGDWVLRADIARLQVPTDHLHLKLTTQLLSAKHPDDRRVVFQQTFSRDQLIKLRDLIDLSLLEAP